MYANFFSPQVGLEPTTNRLTADRSTAELLRIILFTEIVSKKCLLVHCIREILRFFMSFYKHTAAR